MAFIRGRGVIIHLQEDCFLDLICNGVGSVSPHPSSAPACVHQASLINGRKVRDDRGGMEERR